MPETQGQIVEVREPTRTHRVPEYVVIECQPDGTTHAYCSTMFRQPDESELDTVRRLVDRWTEDHPEYKYLIVRIGKENQQ